MTGQVKWFDDKKGFGFIALDGGDEAFVHYSEIQSKGHRSLTQGERVSCEVSSSDRGLRALRVFALDRSHGCEPVANSIVGTLPE